MAEIKQFDRVALIQDYIQGNTMVKAGTIGTLRVFVGGTNAIVQYDYVSGNPKYGAMPVTLLRKITDEELTDFTAYQKLLPKLFHVSNVWAIRDGYDENKELKQKVGIITRVRLSTNELDDEFDLEFDNGTSGGRFNRRFLDEHGAFCPEGDIPKFDDITEENSINEGQSSPEPTPVTSKGPEATSESINIDIKNEDEKGTEVNGDTHKIELMVPVYAQSEDEVETKQISAEEKQGLVTKLEIAKKTVVEDNDDSAIEVTINGFRFNVINGIVIIPSVHAEDLGRLGKAIQKLSNFVN